MATFEVTVPDFGAAATVIPEEIGSAVAEAVALLEREVKIRTPIGVTEAARGSIAGEVRRTEVGDSLGVVGSPLEHVRVLELGRRPGQPMPPPDALELWVRRKIVYSRDRKGPRGGRQKLTTAEARRVAFAIARKIGREGTEAVKMFETAVTDNEARVREIFERAGGRIVLRLGGDA